MVCQRFYSFMYAGILACALSSPSQAATFDFTGLANSPPGERALSGSESFTDGTVTVTPSASLIGPVNGPQPPAGPFAYLDASSGGKPAGLGVCHWAGTVVGGDCTQASDDNITENEVLTLTFNQVVTIESMSLRNGAHDETFNGVIGISTSSTTPISAGDFTQYPVVNPFTTGLTSMVFHIASNATFNGAATDTNLDQLYINLLTVKPVPVPSAFLLFGTGLVGLIGWNYRRAKKV